MSNEHGRRLSKRLAAAAATDYEHDDDFAFVRKSKRIKTDKTDEPNPEAVPETVPEAAPGSRVNGAPKKRGSRAQPT
jgi:kinetochore protein Mis13/DSN1